MKIQQIKDPFSVVTPGGSGGRVILFILLIGLLGFVYYNYFYEDNFKF